MYPERKNQVLALSSSRAAGGPYLETALPYIRDLLGSEPLRIAFVPYAAVGMSYEDYGQKVRDALAGLPYTIEVLTPETARSLITSCDAYMVGGGNTFKLLAELQSTGHEEIIRRRVLHGIPYIGWSAGANVTGRSICTTNDMPITQPQNFLGIRFFSFQINPHYINYRPEGFHGETRDDRLTEFVTLNPGIPVIALPEGSCLKLEGEVLHYLGDSPGYLFEMGMDGKVMKQAIEPGADLSHLA